MPNSVLITMSHGSSRQHLQMLHTPSHIRPIRPTSEESQLKQHVLTIATLAGACRNASRSVHHGIDDRCSTRVSQASTLLSFFAQTWECVPHAAPHPQPVPSGVIPILSTGRPVHASTTNLVYGAQSAGQLKYVSRFVSCAHSPSPQCGSPPRSHETSGEHVGVQRYAQSGSAQPAKPSPSVSAVAS